MTTVSPSTPYLAQAAAATDLEDWGALEEAADAAIPMQTSGRTLWTDGAQEVGVWECTPGPSRWQLETNEFVHLIAGEMTVTPDGGEARQLRAGDTAVFPRGWTGHWQIEQTVRKVYVIF